MRSKQLNEYLRIAVKGKNQTHMNQNSGKKITVSPLYPPFTFTINSQGRCLLKRFLTTSLVPTHSIFFWLSIWNISTPTMYFALCQKLTTCSLTGANGVLHKQTVISTWFAFYKLGSLNPTTVLSSGRENTFATLVEIQGCCFYLLQQHLGAWGIKQKSTGLSAVEIEDKEYSLHLVMLGRGCVYWNITKCKNEYIFKY